MQVERSHSARMHVSSSSSSGAVTFTTCLQGSSPWPEEPVRTCWSCNLSCYCCSSMPCRMPQSPSVQKTETGTMSCGRNMHPLQPSAKAASHPTPLCTAAAVAATQSACCVQEGGLEITFEKSMLPLFWEGIIVTATFERLRDGENTRWILSQPSYVWPSWYCEEGCMQKHQQKPAS